MKITVAKHPGEFHEIEVPDDYYLSMDEFKAKKRQKIAALVEEAGVISKEAEGLNGLQRLAKLEPVLSIYLEVKRIADLGGPMIRSKYAHLVDEYISSKQQISDGI